MQRMKVIPILIIVAMLAFSMRLVDFSMGVSSFTNQAMAAKVEKTDDEKPPSMPKKPDAKGGEDLMKDKAKEEDKADDESAKMSDKKIEKKDGIKWRDAKDETLGARDVRKAVQEDIAKRREALNAKERALVTREALLRAAEQELDQKYREMLQLRSEIEALLDKQSEEEKTRIQSLVKIYEGMKPKDAARIFDTLDLDVLVAVMSRMSERKLSPVLAAMNAERARTVTIMLAEEKQLPTLQ